MESRIKLVAGCLMRIRVGFHENASGGLGNREKKVAICAPLKEWEQKMTRLKDEFKVRVPLPLFFFAKRVMSAYCLWIWVL